MTLDHLPPAAPARSRGSELAYDVVVLAGGEARRLGGIDKALVRHDGHTLIDRLLLELGDARSTVVVGPERPVVRAVTWTREDPPGGGPAAGITAGLASVASAEQLPVLLVAVDMPLVARDTVERLERAARDAGSDGAVLTGRGGRRQLCVLVLPRGLPHLRAQGPAPGLSVRRLVAALDLVEMGADGDEAHDIDTPADLQHLAGSARGGQPD